MSVKIRPGTRLISAVCSTEFIAVRAPESTVDLTIGGLPPVTDATHHSDAAGVVDGFGGGALLGKRYIDANGTVELLCTRAGDGIAAVEGRSMMIKDAKPLPVSD